jgi:carbonic anhydrase
MDAVGGAPGGGTQHRPPRFGSDARPRRGLAVLTCMDARLDPARLLDLGLGDAHVLRNAGGVVTTDVLESLAMSQTRLGTRRVMVVHHTHCAGLATRLPKQSPEATVRAAVRLLRAAPELPHRDAVSGFVLDVDRGTLTEVNTEPVRPATEPARTAAAARSSPGEPLARCLWCRRAFDPRTSSWRRSRRTYCSDLCRLAARAGGPTPL